MRKFSWILALLTALAMVFIACPSEGGGGVDWDLPNVTWKYIEIPGRSQGWHTIDIRIQDNVAKFDAAKSYTITVYGAAPGGGGNIILAGAQAEQNTGFGKPAAADGKNGGRFKLTNTFTGAELKAIGGDSRKDIRVQNIPGTAPVATFWEVLIIASDGETIYKLSEDDEVQLKDNNFALLTEYTDGAGVGITWIIGALGGGNPNPIGYVKEPGSSGFVAVTGIGGVPTEGNVGIGLDLGVAYAQPVGIVTNSTITWTVSDAGTTGATITDGVLTATAEGTVKVLATVVNGKTNGTEDFTAEFSILIKAGLAVGDAIFDLADWLEKYELGVIAGNLTAPLVRAGDPTLTVTANGIEVTKPQNDYSTIDFDLTKTDIPMDIKGQKYKLVVTGKMISAMATKMQLTEKDNPWGTLVAQDITGTAGEAFTLTYDIPAFYLDSGKEASQTTKQSLIRIGYLGSSFVKDVGPEFLIETIKLTFEGPRDALAQYTIKFNSDGGNTIADITVSDGLQVGTLPEPVKDGFKFMGWFLADDTTEIKATTVVTDALDGVTLKAKWVEAASVPIVDSTPTFHYEGTGGTFVTVDETEYTFLYNAPGSLASATPSEIQSFTTGATPRIAYQFPEDWDLYDNVIITYELIKTSLTCSGSGTDECTANGTNAGCTATLARFNKGSAYTPDGDAGYPDLKEGINSLSLGLAAFKAKDGVDGFSFTKNHGGSGYLIRIISVTLTY